MIVLDANVLLERTSASSPKGQQLDTSQHLTGIRGNRPQRGVVAVSADLPACCVFKDRFREGFRMPAQARAVDPAIGPASESLRRTNPRESGEDLAVYGDLAPQRVCRGMVFLGSLRAGSRL